MKCPKCNNERSDGSFDSSVTDSRTSSDGLIIRRRRKCLKCENSWTTAEIAVDLKETRGAGATRKALMRAAQSPEVVSVLSRRLSKLGSELSEIAEAMNG